MFRMLGYHHRRKLIMLLVTEKNTSNRFTEVTRKHSSRMRTGRTLTVFRWRTPPPKKTPPQKDTPPRKFGGTPPKKIRAKSGAPPQKSPPPRKIRAKSGAPPPL